jgi:hypothetical protein
MDLRGALSSSLFLVLSFVVSGARGQDFPEMIKQPASLVICNWKLNPTCPKKMVQEGFGTIVFENHDLEPAPVLVEDQVGVGAILRVRVVIEVVDYNDKGGTDFHFLSKKLLVTGRYQRTSKGSGEKVFLITKIE